jgi:hypothetical protein
MVIRDFVNHHDHRGSHVKCLHWVLMWRTEPGGPLHRLKLRHYCSDTKSLSTDSYYQADVTNFHLDETNEHCPQLFKDFDTIIMVGDHGPHFASHETMHNESTLERKYGKKIILMFLTSYHAYSRADGAGAEDSTALHKDLIAGMPRFGAKAMVNMTNSSHDVASWAYWFPAINRNADVFPPHKHFAAKDRAKWIKKWTEVKFDKPDSSDTYDGYLQYRLVTGIGDWQWTDLVAATRTPDETLCDSCSTKHQHAVLHTQKDCPLPTYIHDLPVFKDLVPDPERIKGAQMASKKAKAKGKAVGFPCKYKDCVTGTKYRKPHTANRHMMTVHEPTDAQYAEMAYPDPTNTDDTMLYKRPKPRKSKTNPAGAEHNMPSSNNKEPAHQPIRQANQEEVGGWNSNEDDCEHPASSSEDEDEEDDDDDQEKDAQGDQFEFETIDAHRLLDNGQYSYLIKWVGYTRRTWEGAVHLESVDVTKYHRAAEVRLKKKEATVAAARLVAGGRERSRRGKNVQDNQANKDRIDDRVDELEAQGVEYWEAYETAQREISADL